MPGVVTADEPTAIRHPKRGKWHSTPYANRWITGCGTHIPEGPAWLEVPLSQTDPEDRCRTCWPTTKDVTP